MILNALQPYSEIIPSQFYRLFAIDSKDRARWCGLFFYIQRMKRLAVFCGSSTGFDQVYKEEAAQLGGLLAKRGLELIYGGGKVGLMGVLADAALKAGGRVHGIIPGFLHTREVAHGGLSEITTLPGMHERKAKIHEISDGFMALPGGYGTLDEFFESLTWAQLGLHQKPVALLNVKGFFTPLLDTVDRMVEEGFLRKQNREILLVARDAEELLERMLAYRAMEVPKWL